MPPKKGTLNPNTTCEPVDKHELQTSNLPVALKTFSEFEASVRMACQEVTVYGLGRR